MHTHTYTILFILCPYVLLSPREGKVLLVGLVGRDHLALLDLLGRMARKALLVRNMLAKRNI